MAKHRLTNMLCWLLTAVMLIVTVGFMNGEALGLSVMESGTEMAYEDLFDDTVMHTVDIIADESAWATMIENAQAEEYIACSVVIDGTAVKNAGVRAKGNTSLSQVTTDRYSLKIEFDHYEAGNSYLGLDKLVLNNLIQDDTYMKDWLTYTLFRQIGAAAPLASFAVVTVNGEYYGLCLALEAVEESFLQRNYGDSSGDLYKPDSAQGGDGSANLCYNGDSTSAYDDIFDSAKTDVTSAEQQELIAVLKAVSEGDVSGLDTEALIRYFAVHNFVVNGDSYTGSMIHNYYLYQSGGKLTMLPWDYNLAFGAFAMGGTGGSDTTTLVNWPLDDPLLSGDMSTRPMLAWIFENEEYKAQYYSVMEELIETCFESGWFTARMEAMTALLTPYVQEDTTSFTDYESFAAAAETLTEFCSLRAESLRGQLDGTIPSTDKEQSAATESLIDAGDLSVSAMGSMNMGGGRMESFRTSAAVAPSQGDAQSGDSGSAAGTSPETGSGMSRTETAPEESSGGQMTRPSGNGGFPGGMPSQGDSTQQTMPQWGGELPDGMELPEGAELPEGMELPEDLQGTDSGRFGQGASDKGNMTGRGGMSGSGGSAVIGLVITGVSAAALLLALLFVWKYRRK